MERIIKTKWVKWMEDYPKKEGLYNVILRTTKESWCGYWNNKTRRFEEAVPELTDKGIDVDYWAELPKRPQGSVSKLCATFR